MELQVDEVYRDLFEKLTSAQITTLTDDITKRGILNPIATWNGVIIDGHHRYNIAKRLGIDFKTTELQFESVFDAKMWMINIQGSRRSTTKKQIDKLIVEMYNSLKKDVGGTGANTHTKSRGVKMTPLQKTAEIVAEKFGVSPSTVKRKVNKAKETIEMGIIKTEAKDVAGTNKNTGKDFKIVLSTYDEAKLKSRMSSKELFPFVAEQFDMKGYLLEQVVTLRDKGADSIIKDLYNKKITVTQSRKLAKGFKSKKDPFAALSHPAIKHLKSGLHFAMTYEEFNEPEFYKRYVKDHGLKAAQYVFVEKSLLLKNPFTEHHTPGKNFSFYTKYWINKTTRPISFEHVQNLEPKIFVSNKDEAGHSIAEWLVKNFKAVKSNG